MSYTPRTYVPNVVFDMYLAKLGYAELKVLLVIIRQTFGWVDKKTHTAKQWDWISQQFFVRKTGLSARAISSAITSLVQKDMILIKNETGKLVYSNRERQLSQKLFFKVKHLHSASEVKRIPAVKKGNTTIIKHTKKYCEQASQGFSTINFEKYKHLKR